MKKIFTILAIISITSISISSCSEEEIKPSSKEQGAGVEDGVKSGF
ncbi:MAG: hypothetical protein ACFB2Y_10335 [Fulvivirga sp.]